VQFLDVNARRLLLRAVAVQAHPWDLAYGSGNTGVVDGDQATRWFVYIEKVIKNE